MKRFCVIANADKKNAYETAYEISDYLKGKGCVCEVIENILIKEDIHTTYTDIKNIPEDTDCVIVLGGDGTMIQAASDIAVKDIPLFGINLGGVGFLTESDPANMWGDIDSLIAGDYRIEKRMMLDGDILVNDRKYSCAALNDFVVSKRDMGKLIGFDLYVNDVFLDSFFADGIIISTPTGSTGYNLSAGGPILSPQIESICVTPICPHSLNDRSFVISGEDKVLIRLTEGKNSAVDNAIIVADGRNVMDIVSGDSLKVGKSEYYTRIILKENTNFYHRMRTKLN